MKMDEKFIMDRYNFELQRKEHLNGALAFPVGLSTAIGTALLAMVRSFTFQEQPVTWIFFLLVFGAAVCLIICTTLLFRTYHNQTYAYLPLLATLDQWAEESAAWFSWVSEQEGDPGDEETFEQNLRRRIIEAADANTRTNDERSAWLHNARRALIGAFIFTATAGLPYAIDLLRADYVEQLNKAAGAAETGPAPAAPRSVPGK